MGTCCDTMPCSCPSPCAPHRQCWGQLAGLTPEVSSKGTAEAALWLQAQEAQASQVFLSPCDCSSPPAHPQACSQQKANPHRLNPLTCSASHWQEYMSHASLVNPLWAHSEHSISMQTNQPTGHDAQLEALGSLSTTQEPEPSTQGAGRLHTTGRPHWLGTTAPSSSCLQPALSLPSTHTGWVLGGSHSPYPAPALMHTQC